MRIWNVQLSIFPELIESLVKYMSYIDYFKYDMLYLQLMCVSVLQYIIFLSATLFCFGVIEQEKSCQMYFCSLLIVEFSNLFQFALLCRTERMHNETHYCIDQVNSNTREEVNFVIWFFKFLLKQLILS